MSLFDSVNCFSSSEMKKLYKDYSDKSLKDVDESCFENLFEEETKTNNAQLNETDNVWGW